MTAASAAYPRKVQIAPDSAGSPGTYADCDLNTKLDWDSSADMVDTTDLNSAGLHKRTPVLLDNKVTLELNKDTSSTPFTSLRSGMLARTQVWLKIYETASTGYYFPAYVESIKSSYDPKDVSKASVSLVGTGTAPVSF